MFFSIGPIMRALHFGIANLVSDRWTGCAIDGPSWLQHDGVHRMNARRSSPGKYCPDLQPFESMLYRLACR